MEEDTSCLDWNNISMLYLIPIGAAQEAVVADFNVVEPPSPRELRVPRAEMFVRTLQGTSELNDFVPSAAAPDGWSGG